MVNISEATTTDDYWRMPPWSHESVRARVQARARTLGRTVRSILKEAGLPLDILHKVPKLGRRIDTFERLALALAWTLPEVLGIESGRITVELTELADRITREALSRVPDYEDIRVHAFVAVYNTLGSLRLSGRTIDDAMIATLVRSISEQWGETTRWQR